MEFGQTIIILSRLFLGALASFLAIMLWAKTRETAWILVIIGIIMAYVETIYSVLGLFGMDGQKFLYIGSIPILSIVLSNASTVFFIAALLVMVSRKYRRR